MTKNSSLEQFDQQFVIGFYISPPAKFYNFFFSLIPKKSVNSMKRDISNSANKTYLKPKHALKYNCIGLCHRNTKVIFKVYQNKIFVVGNWGEKGILLYNFICAALNVDVFYQIFVRNNLRGGKKGGFLNFLHHPPPPWGWPAIQKSIQPVFVESGLNPLGL